PLLADPHGPGRAGLPRGRRPLLTAALDRRAEELVGPQRLAALLAVDGRDRRDRRVAARATPQQHAAALRALVGHLALELLEPPARGAAAEADGDPVAEHLAAFLATPVGGLAHGRTVMTHSCQAVHDDHELQVADADELVLVRRRRGARPRARPERAELPRGAGARDRGNGVRDRLCGCRRRERLVEPA